ncbi:peroxiredoxin family protein [Azospirillum agricola]|uniref:DsrE family protein n=1 Tax=Azospirillum agricola TaxID=1720247 RepID=UPI001AE846B7|nr:DsrE family protein [Azospirillum agricola]MBP2228359.1 peroxiredoxin family protein [Azospirillum agricola]
MSSSETPSAGSGNPAGLAIVLFAGGFDRVHYALVMASAAAATNRPVTLFFTGRALGALLPGSGPEAPGWHGLDPADDGSAPAARDRWFAGNGVATFEELLEACVLLGVRVMACEMGLRALGLPASTALRADVPVQGGGVVTFLNEAPKGAAMLFV